MGRSRKIKTAEELERKWDEFRAYCDNYTVTVHTFHQKSGTYVSEDLKKPITYTIAGFCKFINISRQAFHDYYRNNAKYVDTIARISEECEVDARLKFETGVIPSQLAPLWMSNYGYTTKSENKVEGALPVVIAEDAELED